MSFTKKSRGAVNSLLPPFQGASTSVCLGHYLLIPEQTHVTLLAEDAKTLLKAQNYVLQHSTHGRVLIRE